MNGRGKLHGRQVHSSWVVMLSKADLAKHHKLFGSTSVQSVTERFPNLAASTSTRNCALSVLPGYA